MICPRAESSNVQNSNSHPEDLPTYSAAASSSIAATASSSAAGSMTEAAPPEYTEARTSAHSIDPNGDPNEMIDVPFIASVEKIDLKRVFSGRKTIENKVVVRKMPRSRYLAHYARDIDGNYVGTGKPAYDSALVYVPARSSPEDIKDAVNKTATSKEHYGYPMPGTWA